MARVIHCECGYVARGATDDEVLDAVEAHVRAAHPELGGQRGVRPIGFGLVALGALMLADPSVAAGGSLP
jgi:Protein of unknown function (DUF1059)